MKAGTTDIAQPPYWLGPAPGDGVLFPKLKFSLNGWKFHTIEETKNIL
jgi:hypothetical protein